MTKSRAGFATESRMTLLQLRGSKSIEKIDLIHVVGAFVLTYLLTFFVSEGHDLECSSFAYVWLWLRPKRLPRPLSGVAICLFKIAAGHIFIYSCCASLISFEIDCFTVCEHEYMNMCPPPNYRSSTAHVYFTTLQLAQSKMFAILKSTLLIPATSCVSFIRIVELLFLETLITMTPRI